MNFKLTKIARYTATAAGVLALLYTGCSMCSGPYDYDYPSFGGSVQRSNANWGRVGSVYSDPGPFGGAGADSNLKPHDSGSFNSEEPFESVPEPAEPAQLQLQSPGDGELNGSGTRNGSEILPAPQPAPQTRPSPDEETRRSRIQRLRNQSRKNNGSSTWR